MAGLLTFKEIYNEKGDQFIEKLLNHYVIVSEMIDGTRFRVQRKGDKLLFYKGGDSNPINLIDRTIMVYYERPVGYFDSFSDDVKNLMPEDWQFCFEYVAVTNPTVITYDSLPHNNLIITDILIKNETGNTIKVISDPVILGNWAKTFDVQGPAIIFQGKLNQEQRDKIKDFLKTPQADLENVFKTHSFTRYIISILNPNLKKTALNNSLDKTVKSIVFKFVNGKKVYNAEVIDPMFDHILKQNAETNVRKPNDTYQIIMLDIIEFLSMFDIDSIKIEGETSDQRYINLISEIFNNYVTANSYKYIGMDFQTPKFAQQDVFKLNINFIANETTKKILKNEKMHDLFKIMLSSFKKIRKSPTELLSAESIKTINEIITKIESKIKAMPSENEVLDFHSFLKYNKIQEEDNDIFESQIFEGLSLVHKERGKKKVNIFVGRFQPFTLGHAKVFETIHKQNGLPVVVLIVRGGKPDPERKPFDEDMQLKMFKGMQKNYSFLEAALIVKNASPDTIFNTLRPHYEPVLWGTGSDRLDGYQKMIDKYRTELNADDNFNTFEIFRTDEHVSATKVRDAIKSDDLNKFKEMTPKGIWPLYKEMQRMIGIVGESDEFKVLSFTEYVNEAGVTETNLELVTEGKKSSGVIIAELLAKKFKAKYEQLPSDPKRLVARTDFPIETLINDIDSIVVNSKGEFELNGDIVIVEPGEISSATGKSYSSVYTTAEFTINNELSYVSLKPAGAGNEGPTTEQQENCSIFMFQRALQEGDALVANNLKALNKIYPNASNDKTWLNTFQAQTDALINYTRGYDFSNHEFFRSSKFTDQLYKHAKKIIGFGSKDTWQPADVWIVDDTDLRISEILETEEASELNDYLAQAVRERMILPISLKKTKKSASLEEVNVSEKASASRDKIIEADIDLAYDSNSGKFSNNGATIKTKEGCIFSFRFSTKVSFVIEPRMRTSVAQLGKVPIHVVKSKLNSDVSVKSWIDELDEGGSNEKMLKTYFKFLIKDKMISTRNNDWNSFIEGMREAFNANKHTREQVYGQKCIAMELFYNLFNSNSPDAIIRNFFFAAQKKGKDFGPFIKIY